jgi:hypothetical protein
MAEPTALGNALVVFSDLSFLASDLCSKRFILGGTVSTS